MKKMYQYFRHSQCLSVPGKAFSVLKTHSSVFKDVNGHQEGHSETREEGQYTKVTAGC
jgi:hypothetical protein